MDLLHHKAIQESLAEVKTAAQQAQIALASAQELIANANELVLRLLHATDAIGKQSR